MSTMSTRKSTYGVSFRFSIFILVFISRTPYAASNYRLYISIYLYMYVTRVWSSELRRNTFVIVAFWLNFIDAHTHLHT